LGGPLSKLCVTPPFSINFRCQIENQVSDYRLLFKDAIAFIISLFEILVSSSVKILTFSKSFNLFKDEESTFLFFLFKLLKYLNHSSPGISSDGELELGLSK
jgi:hypothetical protein